MNVGDNIFVKLQCFRSLFFYYFLCCFLFYCIAYDRLCYRYDARFILYSFCQCFIAF